MKLLNENFEPALDRERRIALYRALQEEKALKNLTEEADKVKVEVEIEAEEAAAAEEEVEENTSLDTSTEDETEVCEEKPEELEQDMIKEGLEEDSVNEHLAENVPEMPDSDEKMSIANMLNALIKDELEAIDGYNSTVATIRDIAAREESDKSIDHEGINAVLAEITNEENLHIGQLETLLKMVSPNAQSIEDGKEEAAQQVAEVSDVEQQPEEEEEVPSNEVDQ